MVELKFEQKAVKDVEREFEKVQIDEKMKGFLDMMLPMLEPHLPVSGMAIKGFTWRIIKKWQHENHKSITDIRSFSPEDKFKVLKYLFVEGENTYKKLVKSKEEKEHIEKIFKDSFNTFIKHYQQQS
ncbi:MAG: hypothetical protein EAX96_06685 [Candidatus Lokiarchaeota archaeon]|nr:hypothetical protein [Candidatus Lokiarchaeota archaeon]